MFSSRRYKSSLFHTVHIHCVSHGLFHMTWHFHWLISYTSLRLDFFELEYISIKRLYYKSSLLPTRCMIAINEDADSLDFSSMPMICILSSHWLWAYFSTCLMIAHRVRATVVKDVVHTTRLYINKESFSYVKSCAKRSSSTTFNIVR